MSEFCSAGALQSAQAFQMAITVCHLPHKSCVLLLLLVSVDQHSLPGCSTATCQHVNQRYSLGSNIWECKLLLLLSTGCQPKPHPAATPQVTTKQQPWQATERHGMILWLIVNHHDWSQAQLVHMLTHKTGGHCLASSEQSLKQSVAATTAVASAPMPANACGCPALHPWRHSLQGPAVLVVPAVLLQQHMLGACSRNCCIPLRPVLCPAIVPQLAVIAVVSRGAAAVRIAVIVSVII